MMARPVMPSLLAFNLDVVTQARQLVACCAERPALFNAGVGAHLRHVIEHYDALLDHLAGGLIDYDHRERDQELERSPLQCEQRLAAIADKLAALHERAAGETLSVGFVIGLDEPQFQIGSSTLARELQFVASHAIHHFAILRPLLATAGITLQERFGKAPDTIRHERLQWAN